MGILKKIVTGITVGMLSLVVAGGIGGASADASYSTSSIRIDYDNQVMYITPNAATVLVGYPKVTKKDSWVVKNTQWETYELENNKEVAVDLSHLNPKKDNYIAIRDSYPMANNGEKAALIEIPANDILKKGKYNAETHSIVLYGADGKTEYDDRCSYRTAASGWKDCYSGEGDFSIYEHQGTMLYVRPNGNNQDLYNYYDGVEGYDVFRAGCFAGKEIKVKVPKLANAPSISVDYEKRTFTVKKGCQYRFNGGEWSDVVTEKSVALKLEDYAEKGTDNCIFESGEFEVRKAAVKNNSKYTPPSKIGGIGYNDLDTPSVTFGNTRYGNLCPLGVSGKGNDVVISNAYDETYGIYDVYVSDKQLTSAELASITKGTKRLTAGKLWQPKKLTLKGAKDKYVYIRIAANKKTAQWRTDFVLLVNPTLPETED